LIESKTVSFAPGSDNYDQERQPNYVVINGYRNPPPNLRLRVLPDGKEPDSGAYLLQSADAETAVAAVVSATVEFPLELNDELITGRELVLQGDTTIELRVPYININPDPNQAYAYNLQLFSPGDGFGSRTINGAALVRGPDAFEIEFTVPPGQSGNWLLVLNSNRGHLTSDMAVQLTTCQNSPDVVRYPVEGVCVELRRPPANLSTGPTYREVGNLRLYSPAGFDGDCATSCTTQEQTTDGTPVMPLIGYVGNDTQWVAIKGGTLTLLGGGANIVNTSADARLILADFSNPDLITSLPVLRGRFEASGSGTQLAPTPAAATLLVNDPLESDHVTWAYAINLPDGRLRANGALTRKIHPTPHPTTPYPDVVFTFSGEWHITAFGAPSLQGTMQLDNVTHSPFNVGTLLFTPPAGGYELEYNPKHIGSMSLSLPKFLHVRVQGATIAQPAELGGATLPVQAILPPPDIMLEEHDGEEAKIYCGDSSHKDISCFDLRGPDDVMTADGWQIDRKYQMPDLIVQDQANLVMFNSATAVEVFSSDHPMASSAQGVGFSFQAYGATVTTYQGACPAAKSPPDLAGGQVENTTVVKGHGFIALPNIGGGGGDVYEEQIAVSFTLCETSLRQMSFEFGNFEFTGLPIGNSGLFLHYVSGTVSITPRTVNDPGYTTVELKTAFRGMSPSLSGSVLHNYGLVTIDSRGLFDVQTRSGIKTVADVGVDGHFWVAWSPLDLGFEVEACMPLTGFNPAELPYPKICNPNYLLTGHLRAHMWRGQGWQHKYHWLPDDDSLHVTARFEARFSIPKGELIDWAFVKVPPSTITLEFELAFGEFCTNSGCTSYEWGVLGAVGVLGFDVGIYYGFSSNISFILGSNDHVLIDEAGVVAASFDLQAAERGATLKANAFPIPIQRPVPSAMFGLAWGSGTPTLTLVEPGTGRIITAASTDLDVHVTTSAADPAQTIIVVENPRQGNWQVNIGNSAGAAYNFFYFSNRGQPTVTFDPMPNLGNDPTSVTFDWTSDVEPGDTAYLSLYYLSGSGGLTTTQEIAGPIVERLPLHETGSYTWEEIEALPGGDYTVYARVDNDTAQSIKNCSEAEYNPDPMSAAAQCAMLKPGLMLPVEYMEVGNLAFGDTIAPAAPQVKDARPEGISNVVVRWLPNAELDLAGYIVTCNQGTLSRTVRAPGLFEGVPPAPGVLSQLETAQVNGLNATQATCFVRAYDNSGNISSPSSNVAATPTGQIPAPPAAVTNVLAPVVNGTSATIVWTGVPGASGYQLYYEAVYAVAPLVNSTEASVGTSGAASGGAQAAEGTSPLNVGNKTSFTLTGLAEGMTYRAWLRAYDAAGRTSMAGPEVQWTVELQAPPERHWIYLPLIAK
ncbi:MAG: hypothetical protein ACE5H9_17145, partial [Anaerolineae bacterium]